MKNISSRINGLTLEETNTNSPTDRRYHPYTTTHNTVFLLLQQPIKTENTSASASTDTESMKLLRNFLPAGLSMRRKGKLQMHHPTYLSHLFNMIMIIHPIPYIKNKSQQIQTQVNLHPKPKNPSLEKSLSQRKTSSLPRKKPLKPQSENSAKRQATLQITGYTFSQSLQMRQSQTATYTSTAPQIAPSPLPRNLMQQSF